MALNPPEAGDICQGFEECESDEIKVSVGEMSKDSASITKTLTYSLLWCTLHFNRDHLYLRDDLMIRRFHMGI